MTKENNKKSLIFDVKKSEITQRKQKVEKQVMTKIDPNEWAIIKESCLSKRVSIVGGISWAKESGLIKNSC